MNCTTLYRIDPAGNVIPCATVTAMLDGPYRIYQDLAARYLIPTKAGTLFLNAKEVHDKLWDLWTRKDIPHHHRIALMTTFTGAYCQAQDFPDLVQAFQRYAAELQSPYLETQTYLIQSFPAGTMGCAWHHGGSPHPHWQVQTAEGKRPYNLLVDKTHFAIYPFLRVFDRPAAGQLNAADLQHVLTTARNHGIHAEPARPPKTAPSPRKLQDLDG